MREIAADGLDVTLTTLPNTPSIVAAVVGGSLDIGYTTIDSGCVDPHSRHSARRHCAGNRLYRPNHAEDGGNSRAARLTDSNRKGTDGGGQQAEAAMLSEAALRAPR
jgi:hypothetical protein